MEREKRTRGSEDEDERERVTVQLFTTFEPASTDIPHWFPARLIVSSARPRRETDAAPASLLPTSLLPLCLHNARIYNRRSETIQ